MSSKYDKERFSDENAIHVARPSNKELGQFLKQSMDILADELHAEFGYDTCSDDEKLNILVELFERGWIE